MKHKSDVIAYRFMFKLWLKWIVVSSKREIKCRNTTILNVWVEERFFILLSSVNRLVDKSVLHSFKFKCKKMQKNELLHPGI